MIMHRKIMTICQGILTRNFPWIISCIPWWSLPWFALFFLGIRWKNIPWTSLEHPLNIEVTSFCQFCDYDCLLQEWNVTVFTLISRSSVTFTLLLTTSSSVKNSLKNSLKNILTELLSSCLLINYAHNKIRRNWRSKILSKEQWNKFPGLLFDQVLGVCPPFFLLNNKNWQLDWISSSNPDEKTVPVCPRTGTDAGD